MLDDNTLPAALPRNGRIQSVDRAVALLRAVADAPPDAASLNDLAEATGLNRSTAWRLLATLEHQGLVERRGTSYAVGLMAARIGAAFSSDGLRRRAHPIIAHLASLSGDTATLAITRGIGLYYIDQVSARGSFADSWLGRPVPLHCTSCGKAYLAALPEREVVELLPERLPRFTEVTRTDRSALLADLRETRARGYSTCMGELEPSSFGVAAAVCERGRPIAVVSIWGPPERVQESRFATLGVLVLDAAEQLERLLTHGS